MKKQVKINGTPVGKIQIGYPAIILERREHPSYFNGTCYLCKVQTQAGVRNQKHGLLSGI